MVFFNVDSIAKIVEFLDLEMPCRFRLESLRDDALGSHAIENGEHVIYLSPYFAVDITDQKVDEANHTLLHELFHAWQSENFGKEFFEQVYSIDPVFRDLFESDADTFAADMISKEVDLMLVNKDFNIVGV